MQGFGFRLYQKWYPHKRFRCYGQPALITLQLMELKQRSLPEHLKGLSEDSRDSIKEYLGFLKGIYKGSIGLRL